MKKIITGIALSIFMTLGTWAKDDTPRGYQPTSEFEEVAAKAKAKKKMITILVKGSNDSCPNCVTSVDNGERAVKTYSEFLFCRAKQVTSGKTQLPETIASQLTNISYGASVQFFVFDPFEYKLIARASRTELQDDKKATRAFKDTVREAKKAL